jgi:hypothetical protein
MEIILGIENFLGLFIYLDRDWLLWQLSGYTGFSRNSQDWQERQLRELPRGKKTRRQLISLPACFGVN